MRSRGVPRIEERRRRWLPTPWELGEARLTSVRQRKTPSVPRATVSSACRSTVDGRYGALHFCHAALSAPTSTYRSGLPRIHQALRAMKWDIKKVVAPTDLGVPAFNIGSASAICCAGSSPGRASPGRGAR
jgi:hypothetical protein